MNGPPAVFTFTFPMSFESNTSAPHHSQPQHNQQQQQQQQQQGQQQPKRRRYRIPRSCDRCRASKIKCVFQDGKCVACVNAQVACTFANPGSLRERPPTQKDVEHLQARIRSLERLIQAIDPDLDLSALPSPVAPQHLHSSSNQQTPSVVTSAVSPLAKFTQSLLEAQDPQSDPALSSLFFPSQFKLKSSAGNLAFSVANVDGFSPVDKIIRQEYARQIHWHRSLYPEPDLERSLLDLYFKNVHPCLPLLHPATFMQDLQSGLARTNESFRVLCLTMMAVSSRFSKDPRVFVDLEGHPQRSLQAAGLRYAFAMGSYLCQPISAPANLYDLQSIFLLVVYALGTISPDTAWTLSGIGLERAQQAGADMEDNPKWSNSPIQDHLRRKAFTMLYEFDCLLSAAIGKPPYMQESDFDVLPPDLDYDVAIGTFSNPFDQSSTTDGTGTPESKTTNDLCHAYSTLKSSLGGLKNLFPLMDVMNAHKNSHSDAKISSCVELLITQLDTSMTKCYEKIAHKFSKHESSNAGVTDFQLVSSVAAVTWYHQFRLLMHKVLFNYKGGKSNPREDTSSISTDDQQVDPKKVANQSHAEICIESARMIITLTNRLHQRNLLELGKTMSPDQCNLRCYEITLGVQILNALAPSTFLAEKCSKLIVQLFECVLQQREKQNNKKSSSSSALSLPAMRSSTCTSSPDESCSSPRSPEDKDPNEGKLKFFPSSLSFAPIYSQLADPFNENDGHIAPQDLEQYIIY